MITIEYICNRNNGRSPMAEVIGKAYVRREGLEKEVFITSSGSGLHELFREESRNPKNMAAGVLSGIKNRLYRGRMLEQVDKTLHTGQLSPENIGVLFQWLLDSERICRDYVLWELGLQFDQERAHTPTAPNPDEHLVLLPMTSKSEERVRAIYRQTGTEWDTAMKTGDITLCLLNEYAGLPGDVPNPFTKPLPAYQELRDHLLTAIPRTIERALKTFR